MNAIRYVDPWANRRKVWPFKIAALIECLRALACQRDRCYATPREGQRFCDSCAPRFTHAPRRLPGTCADCGVPVAVGVERCAAHHRPAFYAGTVSSEQAVRRASTDAAMPGETRLTFVRNAETVASRARAELAKRGSGPADVIARAIEADPAVVRHALWAAVEYGAAWKRKIPGAVVVFHAIGGGA